MTDILQQILEGPALDATAFPASSRYHGIKTLRFVAIDGSPSTNATLGSNAAHVTARYDERTFRLTANGVPELVFDARHVKAGGKVAAELIGVVDPASGEAVIAYGWAMAEALADGLSTPRS